MDGQESSLKSQVERGAVPSLQVSVSLITGHRADCGRRTFVAGIAWELTAMMNNTPQKNLCGLPAIGRVLLRS